MENTKTFIDPYDNVEYVIIDKGNNESTTILKSIYDEQQKAAEIGGTL